MAPQFFRVRVDVEPKLKFAPQSALMVMANMAMAGARMPLSIAARFQGDLNKWYPLYLRLPMILRVMREREEVLRKAERLLKIRYSDAPDAASAGGIDAIPIRAIG